MQETFFFFFSKTWQEKMGRDKIGLIEKCQDVVGHPGISKIMIMK